MLRTYALLLVGSLALGCGPGSSAGDAGDVGIDVGRDAAGRDGGRCDMECMAGRACCTDALGENQCLDLATDVRNCGNCGRDCIALRRGDVCVDFQCSCGAAEVGCTGGENSICCPPRSVGGVSYCANTGRDRSDCGMCGFQCQPDRANQCEGGSCTCGLTGAQCAGTPEDLCCTRDAEDYACVDTTTSVFHCGDCANRCNAFETCVAGACVSTLPDGGVDAAASDAAVIDAGTDAG